jgi:hypothetical protein
MSPPERTRAAAIIADTWRGIGARPAAELRGFRYPVLGTSRSIGGCDEPDYLTVPEISPRPRPPSGWSTTHMAGLALEMEDYVRGPPPTERRSKYGSRFGAAGMRSNSV